MSKGWISINREIQDHWVYDDKPFNRLAAWVDLLLLANHKENKFVLGNELITVERGSFVTSELKLMERWGWSNTKVRSFLKLLENDNMIIKKTDSKKSTITIVNYGVYQDLKSAEKVEEKCKESTKKVREHTNNNDNNDNNVNNKISSRFTPPTLEEVRAYCLERKNKVNYEKWYDFYESKGWYVGKNKMKNWKAAVRTWEKEEKDKPAQQAKSTNKFNQFPQREYTGQDYSSLEQALLNKR